MGLRRNRAGGNRGLNRVRPPEHVEVPDVVFQIRLAAGFKPHTGVERAKVLLSRNPDRSVAKALMDLSNRKMHQFLAQSRPTAGGRDHHT